MPYDRRVDGPSVLDQGNAKSLQCQAPAIDASTGGYGQHTKTRALAEEKMEPASVPALDGPTDTTSQPHAESYTFTFGRYYGKKFRQVPMEYLRSLEHNYVLMEREKGLREAFAQSFPRGCFRHEVENYRLNFGKHKSKRMHEVPEEYLASLAANMDQLGNSVVLQHALRSRNHELGRSNDALDATLRTFYKKKRESKI